ncbi:hypothetical protein HBH51_078530 [Parastagonospora nodorum]|nr:hypothetical protein HBH51_078530 [Parastagonospora nodorum]
MKPAYRAARRTTTVRSLMHHSRRVYRKGKKGVSRIGNVEIPHSSFGFTNATHKKTYASLGAKVSDPQKIMFCQSLKWRHWWMWRQPRRLAASERKIGGVHNHNLDALHEPTFRERVTNRHQYKEYIKRQRKQGSPLLLHPDV